MNPKQKEYVERFLSLLEKGDQVCAIIDRAYLNDWSGNNFDFFVEVDEVNRDRHATTRIKGMIERARLPHIVINMCAYNTPRGGNGWKFNGIVSAYFT